MSAYDHAPPSDFEVELPAGGRLMLHSADEVDLWQESSRRYVQDYQLTQQNDLLLLGAILSQQLQMYRAQQRMNGMTPVLDDQGVPTGRYRRIELKISDMSAAQQTITKASVEIRELEKTLGIDKKAREAGGTMSTQTYVTSLKSVARKYGLHLNQRMKAYEQVMMEARWKIRLLHNGDAEDRAYHKLTDKTVVEWLEQELAALEQLDREFAKAKHAVFLGRL